MGRIWFIAGVIAIPLALVAGIAIGILSPGIWPFAPQVSTASAGSPEGAGRADAAPLADGKKAEQLALAWGYGPNPGPPNRSNMSSAAGRRGFVDLYFRDNGKAKAWFDKAVTFYAEKCGSDFNPITNKKHVIGHHGTNKSGGQYVITEPGLMIKPLGDIPREPKEILFTCDDSRSSVTILVRQENEDVVTIMVVAAPR